MLGVVLSGTARPNKYWILSHGSVFPLSQHHHYYDCCRRQRQTDLRLSSSERCIPASVSRGIERPRGEGSWNVAWDGRPARWLHRPESVWLLYGVCACLAQVEFWLSSLDENVHTPTSDDKENEEVFAPASEVSQTGVEDLVSDTKSEDSDGYKITGVLADGRCLFRAIAHGACLRRGEGAPDENRERELADELRSRVAEELLKRREDVESFFEDFDEYVKRIEQPQVWGGEPELLMASHVLKATITVFTADRATGKLKKLKTYGEEYREEEKHPINVLFHEYGHYEILEPSNQRNRNADTDDSSI